MRRALGKLLIAGIVLGAWLALAGVALGQAGDDAIPETGLSDLDMWNLVAGFALPLALAAIIQTGWSRSAQSALVFGVCLGMAVITTALEGDLDFQNWVTSALTILVATIASYQGVWKPTGVAPAIERKTTITNGNGRT